MAEPVQIPLTPAPHVHAPPRYEAPYRQFLFASLALGIGGGFALGILLSLAQALEWDWGRQWPALVQVHGQLQLIGFAGLFVMGMSLRLMPRFSGQRLVATKLIAALVPLVAASLVIRSLAQPAADSVARNAGLIASGVLLLAAGLAFVTVVWGTLAHRGNPGGATAWYFMLGSLAFLAGAAINVAQVARMAEDGTAVGPLSREPAQLVVQHFGFIMLFTGGVVTRAVPVFTGRPRPEAASKVAACTLAAGVAVFATAAIRASYVDPSETLFRIEDAGLLLCFAAFAGIVWLSGAFHPRANRVAAASRLQFQFVRFALAWLLASSLLGAWYAARAFADGAPLDVFEIDAVRHMLTLGVLTMLVMGMGMLVVPEFAGRRLQHPNEAWVLVAMLVALNAAVVLRVWPAVRGLDWIASTRYWPMALAGVLAEAAVIAFALMFLQSYLEQRRPRWAAAENLPPPRAPRDP